MSVLIRRGEFKDKINNPVIVFNPESDHFQNHSYFGIENEQAVITSAPTGSGKTRVIQYGIAYYLNKGMTVAVTTPLKALSNQKFKELVDDLSVLFFQQTGKQITVGLVTGDLVLNPEADVIVMTTEILSESINNFKENACQKETHLKPTFIQRLGCVIFDEAHYCNDEDRGKVWEKALVQLPQHMNVVLVSATFPNIRYYATWLSKVRKRNVCLVEESKRVVPLIHHVFVKNQLITVIQDNKFNKIAYNDALRMYKKEKMDREKDHKPRTNLNLINKLINVMEEENILQTLFFVFSRKGCEDFAKYVTRTLVTHEEIKEINLIFEQKMRNYKHIYEHTPQYILIRELLNKGVCFHHAKVFQVLKEVIEILYAKKLIKLLFVTETMAAGLNMPAKTVVFSSLRKISNKGWRNLNPMEYIQMAGRAGRRGLDPVGNVIIAPIYDLPESHEIEPIVNGQIENVKSRMNIDYSLLLKIIGTGNYMDFMNNSLLKTELDDEIEGMKKELSILTKKYNELGKICNSEFDMLYENDMKSNNGIPILPSKKMQKQLISIKNSIQRNPELKKSYDDYLNIKSLEIEMNKLNDNILYSTNYITDRSLYMLNILYNMGFMDLTEEFETLDENTQSEPTIDDYVVSAKGIMAAQINECNPLLLSEMILYDRDQDDDLMFSGLKAEEIVGLLAIFVTESKNDNDNGTLLSELDFLPNIVNRINKVHDIIHRLQDVEDEFGFANETYWEINYNYVHAMYAWARGETFMNSMSLVGGDQDASDGGGGFMKYVQKINNLVGDIISQCNLCNNLKLLPELEKIEKLIIRNEVTTASLYVE